MICRGKKTGHVSLLLGIFALFPFSDILPNLLAASPLRRLTVPLPLGKKHSE